MRRTGNDNLRLAPPLELLEDHILVQKAAGALQAGDLVVWYGRVPYLTDELAVRWYDDIPRVHRVIHFYKKQRWVICTHALSFHISQVDTIDTIETKEIPTVKSGAFWIPA